MNSFHFERLLASSGWERLSVFGILIMRFTVKDSSNIEK